MKIYCRGCGVLLKENVDVMSTTQFKWKYKIENCPACDRQLSGQFKVRQVKKK